MPAPYAKIENHPNLIRDMNTQAILNTDRSIIRKHEERIQKLQKEEVRDKEINTLKNDITEIKTMLAQLLGHGR